MFSHLNKQDLPHMVDITQKKACLRKAVAQGTVKLNKHITGPMQDGQIHTPKGAVFSTAIIAGIQAVKNTASLIPLCHNIPISHCNIDIEMYEDIYLKITCDVSSAYSTGVEIEAITGVSVSAITIYDMCKSINNDIVISEIKLLSKEKME